MCQCNKSYNPKNYINNTKIAIRKIWENTKTNEKAITITKINKS